MKKLRVVSRWTPYMHENRHYYYFFPINIGMQKLQRGWTRMLKSFQWLLIWLLKLLQLLLCPGFSQSAFFSPEWHPSEDFIKSRNNIIHFLCAKARGASQHGSSKVWLGCQARVSCWALNPEFSRMWGGGFLRLSGHSSNPQANEWITQR